MPDVSRLPDRPSLLADCGCDSMVGVDGGHSELNWETRLRIVAPPPVEHSDWNRSRRSILCGAGVTSGGGILPRTGVRAFLPAGLPVSHACQGLEHFAPDQNRSR